MSYYVYMIRRDELEDREDFLERQCFNLNPDMWVQFYKDRMLGDLDANDGGLPVTEDDLDELDEYMRKQEQAWKDAHTGEQQFQQTLTGRHVMSGAQAPLQWGDIEHGQQAQPLKWGAWQ